MADTAYPTVHATCLGNRGTTTKLGVHNDAGDSADNTNKVSYNRDKIRKMCELAAKCGMLYRSNGAPNSSPIAAGAFCIDYANEDVYVCTDRSTPTWTVLAE